MKEIIIILSLLLITVGAFTQAPDWEWATGAGGYDSDYVSGITTDNMRNSYLTGEFDGDATFGSYSLTSYAYSYDIFVAKINENGIWQWAAKAGGTQYDAGRGIVNDESGNIYISGLFQGTATFGSHSLVSSDDIDIFVAKLDTDGNWLWAAKAGDDCDDCAYGITIDEERNCYITGYFECNATFGSFTIHSNGSRNIFVAKIDSSGNWLWATDIDGIGYNYGYGISVDATGNSYITGIKYNATSRFGSQIIRGIDDIIVAKFDTNGNPQWTTFAGGSSDDRGYGITNDNSGNCYVTGIFNDTATFGSYSISSSGYDDIFIAKLNPNGIWQWVTVGGGSAQDWGRSITIDDLSNCYITGHFGNTATFGSHSVTSSGGADVFVAKMDIEGNWLWV
ncbi:MAG TPA: hypothetical protein ENL20_11810, partial [Candidatus Cloacimonetes bacterium]|nr:hypothetical protein [Candidatus Cloacimonadota bacterium]